MKQAFIFAYFHFATSLISACYQQYNVVSFVNNSLVIIAFVMIFRALREIPYFQGELVTDLKGA
jgi:hypothetical protein